MRNISWAVCIFPGLIAGESTIKEYVEQFEVGCIRNGIEVRRVGEAEVGAEARKHVDLKKKLRQHGFVGRDWRHLMAAVAAKARVLVTVDEDFWDPENKSQRKSKRRLVRVKSMIEAELEVKVRLPSEIDEACCA